MGSYKRLLITSFLGFTLCLTVNFYAYSETISYVVSDKSLNYVNKENSKLRAQSILSIDKAAAENSFKLSLKGKGKFNDFSQASQLIESYFTVSDGVLKTEKTLTSFKDKDNLPLKEYVKIYNYDKGEVKFKEVGENGEIITEKYFKLKGLTADDVTMAHFLRAYFTEGVSDRFYLLTNEPKMYHVMIKNLGKETLTINNQERETIKLQLMADLGPMTELAAKFVPPTFVWYDANYPHQWLKYEGMELGYKSANIQIISNN